MKTDSGRRLFMKTAAICAAWGGLLPVADVKGVAMALKKNGEHGMQDLLKALSGSHPQMTRKIYDRILADGGDPWEIHRSLYPVVQRVLNPPFINPHLPKMYAVCRELAACLRTEDLPILVRVEIGEYARRPKLEMHPRPELPPPRVVSRDMATAFGDRDRKAAAALMAGFYAQAGGTELARRLLLLGSGYLNSSLGHSISCTAFILQEMLERSEDDPWPALFGLAHYFCEGRFHAYPEQVTPAPLEEQDVTAQMRRATSGRGIVNLHHTITFYALDRVRSLFTKEEYGHVSTAVVRFMGDKKEEHMASDLTPGDPPRDYAQFFDAFSSQDTERVIASVWKMTSSETGRKELGRYLVKGVCDLYQGDYDPHFLTGLASLLWVLHKYPAQEIICRNALYQYLDYYFRRR